METGGVQCRYRPTCSHYAEDAIAHYGFVSGSVRAMGRIWRCSPWGGSGYDPAVEEHSAAFVDSQQQQQQQPPPQETPEQRKAREDSEKKAAEDFRKAVEELKKIEKQAPEDIGRATGECLGGCARALIKLAIWFVLMVVALIFVWKDSKARGDPNQLLWMVLVFVFSWLGAIAYFFARPKGDLTPCPLCHQRRLSTLALCPHCKNAGAAPPPPAAPPKPTA
jgi:putative membrane protein insertion efficiency factor